MSYTITRNYDGYGSGFLSPGNQYFYVNISKNASSYMVDTLTRQGWTAARFGYDDCDYRAVKKLLIVLRDPVDRWCSGVSQYLVTKILNYIGPNTYHNSDYCDTINDEPITASLIERFIFDNLDMLDDHVWAQHEFYENILPNVPRCYIVLDKNFKRNLNVFGIETFDDADRNDSRHHRDKAILTDFFRRRLEHNPSLLDRVKLTYARDYEIIKNL